MDDEPFRLELLLERAFLVVAGRASEALLLQDVDRLSPIAQRRFAIRLIAGSRRLPPEDPRAVGLRALANAWMKRSLGKRARARVDAMERWRRFCDGR